MATPSSILTWRIPWTEEPGGLQFMQSQRITHNIRTNAFIFFQGMYATEERERSKIINTYVVKSWI